MTSPFSRTALVAVVAGTLLSIALAGALTAFGDDLTDPVSASADSYSKSAIGHRALVRLLDKLEIPVVVSRSESSERAQHGLLLVIEPIITDDASRDRLERLMASGTNTLVVLPKWHGFAAERKPWIERATYVSPREVNDLLKVVDYDVQTSEVVRVDGRPTWVFADDPPGPAPELAAPQLIHSTTIGRAIGDGKGNILLGNREHTATLVWVLTDPDVLNNQGLRRPENARFIVQLIEGLRNGGPVVIDETMHGYARPPSVMRTLLAFPLVVVTIQIIACAILIIWAAMVRFGPRRAAPPPIAPGKDFLVRNTAALLHYGGHHADAVQRYLRLTVADVRRELHAPAASSNAWLEDVRRSRGGTISLPELERLAIVETHPKNLIALADRIYRWRMEMTHGLDRST